MNRASHDGTPATPGFDPWDRGLCQLRGGRSIAIVWLLFYDTCSKSTEMRIISTIFLAPGYGEGGGIHLGSPLLHIGL